MAKNWISAAIGKKGAFSKQAKRAGMSTAAYARKVTKTNSRASATTQKRAQLAMTLAKLRKRR